MTILHDGVATGYFGEQLTVPAANGARRAYNIPPGMSRLMIEPTAAMRFQWTPAIRAVWFYDASAPANARWKNLTRDVYSSYHAQRVPRLINGARDASAAYPGHTQDILASMTAQDFIYVGVVAPIGGLYIEVSGANDQNQALSVAHSSGGDVFASIASITDGTDSTGTLAQDGAVTWTAPDRGSLWQARRLNDILRDPTMPRELNVYRLFWLRLSVAGTLAAATQLDYIAVLAVNAMGGVEGNEGGAILKADVEYTADIERWLPVPNNIGALEVMAQADSATTAQATWVKR
ncbi:MAG: hypothetical protein U0990_06340 [Candidatus Nanopelagicales bacterium]|nr:hypothetical protein [Candidatus Nanopelagicales bacterium]